jgi:hypothetical protein
MHIGRWRRGRRTAWPGWGGRGNADRRDHEQEHRQGPAVAVHAAGGENHVVLCRWFAIVAVLGLLWQTFAKPWQSFATLVSLSFLGYMFCLGTH